MDKHPSSCLRWQHQAHGKCKFKDLVEDDDMGMYSPVSWFPDTPPISMKTQPLTVTLIQLDCLTTPGTQDNPTGR